MKKKPIAYVGTSILLFSTLLPTGVVFAESIAIEAPTAQSGKTLESVQSKVAIPEQSSEAVQESSEAATSESSEPQVVQEAPQEEKEAAQEEAVAPTMTLKQKTADSIKEGEKVEFQLFGNLPQVTLALPEGLIFDANDHLDGDEKPSEDYAWNEEKRELTIKNIAEEEAAAKVLILTVEKAGHYELAVFDEETNYESEKIAFDVAEKEEVKEEKTEDSTKESKEETTESSKEEKKDAEKAAKKAPRANEVIVGLTAATTHRTYTDPVSGLAPAEYAGAVPLSISTVGLTGVKVEIPYGFTPDPSNANFKHFTMTDPIFSFINPGTPAADSIVDHYEDDTTNQKLIIHLKTTKTTVETVNLRFKFNPDYDGKIPTDQVIWQDLQTTAYDSANNQISQSGKVQVKGAVTDGMEVGIEKFYPDTSTPYTSGAISNRYTVYNRYNKRSLLDETADNKVYIEFPTGSTVSTNLTTYYNGSAQTNSDDSSIPIGYTRHYREISDSSEHYRLWAYNGNVESNFNQIDGTVIPPTSLSDGDNFYIETGISYKKVNSNIKTKTSKAEYTKQEQKDWELTAPALSHYTGGSTIPTINMSSDSTVSTGKNHLFGFTNYHHRWTGKNTGKRDILNTRFVLYQKSSDSKKLNFESISVLSTKDIGATSCYYRVDFEIKNAISGVTRNESSAKYNSQKTIPLPSLNQGEFIDVVKVIPLGTDGLTEGAWSPSTGFSIEYFGKNWASNKWPDGTAIPTKEISEVEMGGTLYYDDETNNQAAVPSETEINSGYMHYVPGSTTDTYVTFVSGNANSRQPGDTVDYEIQGYNLLNAVSDVINPEVTVAVPKVLQMQNVGTAKDFYDATNGQYYPKSVTVSLISSDATYNYYRFKATATGLINKLSVSYKIPVSFKVASGTPVGNYTIPATTVTNKDFFQMTQATNNLSDSLATSMGYDNTVASSYTGRTTGHTALSVVYASKLNGDTSARKGSGDSWTETTHFAVDKKGTPQMKATINNTGNTSFTNVRLYDILPSSSDGRGSSGNIDFTGLDSSSGTVYYTTAAVGSLPDYSSDLQTWNAAKLTSHGFSTTPPADMKDVTAIYIDFGAQVVNPNDTLDTVMNFLVPDADNQKAVNQFQYSAKEVGSGTTLNANSSNITFSTEVAKVAYDENLPSFMASGETAAGNMPDDQAVLLDVSGNGSITLSSKKPTMTGYTFVKWQDKANASKDYQPGDKIDFTSASTELNLKAIWKAVSVNVTYKKNDDTTANVDVKTYDFGDTVSLSAVTNPTRTGYQFKGWGTTDNAATADFTDGTRIDFVANKTVYAIWEANTYTVQFDKNGGTGTMTDQAFTYDTAAKLKKNTYTRAGYAFKGWAKTSTAVAADYVDEASVVNLSSTDKATVKVFAVWEAQDQTIQFDVNGGDASSKPNDIVEKTDTNVNISSVKAPTRTGYTFDGWYNGATAVTGTIKMPAGGMILKAAWKANKYKVTFDANKGGGTMAAQDFTYDTAQNLTANTFTRSGYSFVGWATSASGTSAYVDQQSVNNLTATNNETIKLYAVWSPTAQVLQFDVNGGDASSKPANIASTTDATVDISKVKDPTRTGYKFTGWYDGATKVGSSIVMPVGGKTLRAEWEAISYKVNFHANTGNGTAMAKQQFTYDAAQNLTKNTYTKAGYAFDGWLSAQNSPLCDYIDEQSVMNLSDTHDAEVTVYASWRALDQTVTFDVNGGDITTKPLDIVQVTDSTVDISTVVSPTRTGYTFAGWYDGANKATNTFTMPAGGKTLRAEWTPINYSIAFDGNSGDGTMADQTFEYDLNQSLSKNEFTKAGYSFTGWSTKKDDPIVYTDEDAILNLTDVDGDKITLFANWKADDQTVTFDVNGGDETTKPGNIVQPTDSTVDLTKVDAPKRTGYIFKGWYETSDKMDDSFVMSAGGKNLRAEWTPIKYSVTFDSNSGSGKMSDQAFEYDTEQALSKNEFTKAGYGFAGWSSKKDGEVEYKDEQALKNLTTVDDEKITVYAIWQAEDQTITFDVNGGDDSSKPADIVAKTGEKVDIDNAKAPTRDGYEFTGWFLKDKEIGGVIEMPAGGMTLVAQWKKKDVKDDTKDDDKLPGTGDSGTGSSNSKSTYISGSLYRGGTTNNGTGTSGKNLPKTGSEYQSPLTALMGLCIVAGTTVFAWFRRNKKDTEK